MRNFQSYIHILQLSYTHIQHIFYLYTFSIYSTYLSAYEVGPDLAQVVHPVAVEVALSCSVV